MSPRMLGNDKSFKQIASSLLDVKMSKDKTQK